MGFIVNKYFKYIILYIIIFWNGTPKWDDAYQRFSYQKKTRNNIQNDNNINISIWPISNSWKFFNFKLRNRYTFRTTLYRMTQPKFFLKQWPENSRSLRALQSTPPLTRVPLLNHEPAFYFLALYIDSTLPSFPPSNRYLSFLVNPVFSNPNTSPNTFCT